VLAAGAILNAGTEEEKQALLPGIAAGETIATLAWVEGNGRWDAEGTALTTTSVGGKTLLNEHKTYVVDGKTADLSSCWRVRPKVCRYSSLMATRPV
jgi:alkylation response protein AidB-like acyl-CoA dehydrogenase